MSAWEPHLTVRAAQPFVAGLEALGYAADPLLRAAAIPRALLADPDGRVPQRAVGALWQRALDATGDDDLGLHLAEAAPVASFDLHAHALLSSATLRDAYRRGCRYQRLINEVTDLTLTEGGDEGVLRHALPGGRPVARQAAEFLATVWVRFGRLVTGTDWVPSLVCFGHAQPASTREHQRVFRAPLRFSSGQTAMHVPNRILDTPNPGADSSLAGVLDRYADELLRHVPRRATLSDRVRIHVIETSARGTATAEGVARALALSVRSLHRGLRSEGTTFRALREQLRRERAAALLAESRYSIAEVAFLLGFAELSSFYRAFKRWTGRTPAEVRAEARVRRRA